MNYLQEPLFSNVDEGDPVPADLFDIVAEVILWAQNVTQAIVLKLTIYHELVYQRRHARTGIHSNHPGKT